MDACNREAAARRRSTGSPAYRVLSRLRAGDPVPPELYVDDYADGTRAEWHVHSTEPTESGGALVVLVDRGNTADGMPVALWVWSHPRRTLRSQPYLLGTPAPADRLCDFDQQGRAVRRGT